MIELKKLDRYRLRADLLVHGTRAQLSPWSIHLRL